MRSIKPLGRGGCHREISYMVIRDIDVAYLDINQMKQKLCLNIGSGLDYRESNEKEKWINIDKSIKMKSDLSINFIKEKLPFEDNSIDLIICKNLLSHIKYKNTFWLIREVHRVLKEDGIFSINTIHFSSRLRIEPALVQTYSVRFLREMLLDSVEMDDYFNFTDIREIKHLFKEKLINLKWTHDKVGVKGILSKVVSFFGSLFPSFCDRIWCYWVGGFDLIEGEFIKIGEI